ncbi:hypothetical protein BH09ACT1_BH09ACT1_27980 [soil metagenome]
MIGYYVHHRGLGHLHRALAIAAKLAEPVTILSSLPRPESWDGGWIDLPVDTDVAPRDARAGGTLHWVPLGSTGLRTRMTTVSTWITAERPSAIVIDVSVEVAMLVRLHGVPVITFAQPGDRTDVPHTVGYGIAAAVIAPWPARFDPLRVSPGVDLPLRHTGAISRFDIASGARVNPRQIAVLNGAGGRGVSALGLVVAEARRRSTGFDWIELTDAPADVVAKTLRESAIVFAHCGQNALAEIAVSRVPAVLVAEERPHEEQTAMAESIAGSGLPAFVTAPEAVLDWTGTLTTVRGYDGALWSEWCDGLGAERAAAVIEGVAREHTEFVDAAELDDAAELGARA